MVIELLQFRVPLEQRDWFVHQDREIWTTALSNYPGFISKQVWFNPTQPTEVTFVIYWNTREEWKAIPLAELDAIAQKFDQVFAYPYELIAASEYAVI